MTTLYLAHPRRSAASTSLSHYFRPSTISAELPRGVTANNDVLFNETTQTLMARGGSGYDVVWDWSKVRVGSFRHTVATRLTATDWTTFLAHVATFVAGTGDYEILVPSAMTMTGNGTYAWRPPDISGKRWLFVTYNGTLPTADVMPSEAQLNACSVWTGPAAAQDNALVFIDSPNQCGLTLTGIVMRPQSRVEFLGQICVRNASATTMADAPYGVVLDRCMLDGTNIEGTTLGQRTGMTVNGQQITVLESWIIGIRQGSSGYETKGILGYSQSKYQVFRNVMIEASGICQLYGGADPVNPNTGINDPSDILNINTVANKKLSWMTVSGGNPATGMKNGYESKNVSRWFLWNCISNRNAKTGQDGITMLFQNLQDSFAQNWLYNINADIVVHNHQFKDCPGGVTVLSRVNYTNLGPSTLPVNPTRRVALTNMLLAIGNTWGQSGSTTRPLRLFGDIQGVLWDQNTYIPTANRSYYELNGSGASQIIMTNMAGDQTGIFGETPVGNFGQVALSSLGQYCSGAIPYTWAGNAGYGSPVFGGGTYSPGFTSYANAAAMGMDTTTGVLGSPGNVVGVGGQSPGVNFTAYNAGMASMASWAFTR